MHSNGTPPPAPDWLTATEAAARLGISRSTLYSYVSRDLLHPVPAPGPHGGRGKRYRRGEVERLARRHGAAREPRRVAGTALDFGLPVLESSLALIDQGRLHYRGHDVAMLVETASLEDIAALLWDCDAADLGRNASPCQPPAAAAATPLCTARTVRTVRTPEHLLAAFHQVLGTAVDAEIDSNRPASSWWLVQAMLAAATGQHGASHGAPLHEQLRRAWALPEAAGDELRRALVLCADHELNASSFTARCVASTGATPAAAVAAALAALTGPKHGGMTTRVEAIWAPMLRHATTAAALQQWLAGQPPLPAFGHTLYPEGDPRAALLLQRLPPDRRRERLVLAVQAQTGKRPNLDFGLVALRRALGAPEGAALALFAIGRTVGWLAHAFEQRRDGRLIRPRAAYVGPRPAPDPPAPVGRVIRR